MFAYSTYSDRKGVHQVVKFKRPAPGHRSATMVGGPAQFKGKHLIPPSQHLPKILLRALAPARARALGGQMKRATITTTVGTTAGAAAGFLVGFIAGAGLMAVKSGQDPILAETDDDTTVIPLRSPRAAMGDAGPLPRSG
jgi:hypothetical protein